MHWCMDSDWRWLHTFLVAAQEGSLSKAARVLEISQPTASRHVQSLEATTRTTLFVRHSRGLSLTADGAALLEEARGLDVRVRSLLRRTTGTEAAPRGVVRLSVNEPIGAYVLAPWYGLFRRAYPEVALEVVIDNQAANLGRRDADIAVRMFPPTQLDLIATKIADVPLGLFAHNKYLRAHRKIPLDIEHMHQHTIAGFDMEASWLGAIAELGLKPEQFNLRCNSLAAHIEAVRSGSAIGGLHVAMARTIKGLVQVLEEIPLPPLELWVVLHENLRHKPAIRVTKQSLVQFLSAYVQV